MKTIILASISLALQAGACNAGEPGRVPSPIDATDIALLLGLHKFQVQIPDEMIGGPVFVKVFYVQPDGTEVVIGGCGTGKSQGMFDVLLKEPDEGNRFRVITRCAGGFSTSENPVDDIGKPQQWFSDKIASNGDTLAVFWNKARIIVRIRPTVDPVWKDDGEKPEGQGLDANSPGSETARNYPSRAQYR